MIGVSVTNNPGPAPVNTPALTNAVKDLLGFQASAAEQTANAQAAGVQSQGAAAEATAYQSAEQIAQQNAQIAGYSGQIQQEQVARQVQKTVGAQRADVSAAGFKSAGSALGLLRGSLQQGYLSNQLIAMQTGVNQGSYLEAGAAAEAQRVAASSASTQAQVLQQAETDAASANTVNAANETAGLTAYLKTHAATPEGTLATSIAAGSLGNNLMGTSPMTQSPLMQTLGIAPSPTGQYVQNGQGKLVPAYNGKPIGSTVNVSLPIGPSAAI